MLRLQQYIGISLLLGRNYFTVYVYSNYRGKREKRTKKRNEVGGKSRSICLNEYDYVRGRERNHSERGKRDGEREGQGILGIGHLIVKNN